MPRRGQISKRDVLPDPVYNSKLVTKLINNIMYDGKRGVAQKIVYDAFEIVEKKTDKSPLEAFNIECFQRRFVGLFFYDFKCIVNDLLCNASLAVVHNIVDELGYKLGIIYRIRQNVSLGYLTSSRHCTSLLH